MFAESISREHWNKMPALCARSCQGVLCRSGYFSGFFCKKRKSFSALSPSEARTSCCSRQSWSPAHHSRNRPIFARRQSPGAGEAPQSLSHHMLPPRGQSNSTNHHKQHLNASLLPFFHTLLYLLQFRNSFRIHTYPREIPYPAKATEEAWPLLNKLNPLRQW